MDFQATTVAVITMIAKVALYVMSNPEPATTTTAAAAAAGDEEAADKSALIDLPPNSTMQTTTWRYSKTPNALLFDFGMLNMKKEQMLSCIKASLPANIHVYVQSISGLLAEIAILDQDTNDATHALHKQAYSILKNKGLHLKDKNIWLKPTSTLTMYPNFVSWQLRLSGYPTSMMDDMYKQKIADTIKDAFGKRSKENLGKKNVLFSSTSSCCGGRDRDYQHCSVTILVKEYTITPPPSINPIRKLIYVPFLKDYLPIDISRVE
ncbi:hypothetical protein MBANPS3_005579 [Mucor bainieri]